MINLSLTEISHSKKKIIASTRQQTMKTKKMSDRMSVFIWMTLKKKATTKMGKSYFAEHFTRNSNRNAWSCIKWQKIIIESITIESFLFHCCVLTMHLYMILFNSIFVLLLICYSDNVFHARNAFYLVYIFIFRECSFQKIIIFYDDFMKGMEGTLDDTI